MNGFRPWLALLFLLFGTPAISTADDKPAAKSDAAAKVSFFRDIRPILQERCQGCHQPAKASGGLVLTEFAGIKKGGESEQPGVVPGKPDESAILSQVLPSGKEPPLMPKGADPLRKDQIELIRRWIAEGATDDTPQMTVVQIDLQHPPVYALPPVLTSVDYSPDGSLLAVSGYHEVLLHRSIQARLHPPRRPPTPHRSRRRQQATAPRPMRPSLAWWDCRSGLSRPCSRPMASGWP